jgi:hypothetical protein
MKGSRAIVAQRSVASHTMENLYDSGAVKLNANDLIQAALPTALHHKLPDIITTF